MYQSEAFPHILKAEIFSDLPKYFAKKVVDSCTHKHIEKAQTLLTEGSECPGVSFLCHGTVDVFTTSLEGQRIFLHRVEVGEIFGDIEVLTERPSIASCEAQAGVDILFCGAVQFRDFVQASPKLMRNMFRIAQQRIERSNRFKVIDSSPSIEQRLCAYLSYLSIRTNYINESQSFLAELTGCSRQTINRLLGELRAEGIIDTRGSQILVRDPAALRKRSESV